MPDELQYEPPSPNLDRPRSSAGLAAVLAVFVVLLAGGAATYYFLRRPAAAPAGPSSPAVEAPASGQPAAPPPPTIAEPSPPLDASDDFVRRQLAGLGSDEWRGWLQSDGLARRFVAATFAVGEGKSPRRALERPFLTGRFAVTASGGETRIDPASYARYDRIAATVSAIDPGKAAAAYRTLRPLLDEAWAEIGAPGETLDSALRRAIDQLLAAPEVGIGAEVELRDGLYHYRDPALESATAAQKHLMRMGPANAATVKEALRRLRAAL
jgi:hypothetical protein